MANRSATRPLRPSAVGEVGDGVVCDGGGRRGKPVAWFYTLGGYGVGRSIGQWTVPKKGSTHERRGPARGPRLHRAQGGLPQATAPDRGAGTRPSADGRGGAILHRHPNPGLRDDQGAARGLPRSARGAPGPLDRKSTRLNSSH